MVTQLSKSQNLIFNTDTHEYTTPDGVRVPSVSEIIRSSDSFYSFGSQSFQAHRDRGTELHEALFNSHHYKGLFAQSIPDSEVGWYILKWLEIQEVEGIVPIEGEKIVGSEELGHAGRLDLRALVRGKKALLDFKTGKSMDNTYTAVQLSGYAIAEGDIEEIYGLCIHPEVNKKGYRLKLLPDMKEVFERLKREYYLRRDKIFDPNIKDMPF